MICSEKGYGGGYGGGDGYKQGGYRKSEVQLIRDNCSLKPKLIDNFKETIKSYGYSLTASTVAHMKAFRFPRSNNVILKCKVNVCYGKCPNYYPCQP
jgi:hypothetical protein